MVKMDVLIRPFADSDCDRLVEILELNGQYGYPEVEGPDAMKRVAACDAAYFLVAEVAGQPAGLVRGNYDGSRAMIHLLSVSPEVQRKGIGKALVAAAQDEVGRRGAPGLSVTVTHESAGFWKKLGFGFGSVDVRLMLKTSLLP